MDFSRIMFWFSLLLPFFFFFLFSRQYENFASKHENIMSGCLVMRFRGFGMWCLSVGYGRNGWISHYWDSFGNLTLKLTMRERKRELFVQLAMNRTVLWLLFWILCILYLPVPDRDSLATVIVEQSVFFIDSFPTSHIPWNSARYLLIYNHF
jgi:hypothetical protein